MGNAQIPEGGRFAAASLSPPSRMVFEVFEIASRQRLVGEGVAAFDEGALVLGRPRGVAPEGPADVP